MVSEPSLYLVIGDETKGNIWRERMRGWIRIVAHARIIYVPFVHNPESARRFLGLYLKKERSLRKLASDLPNLSKESGTD